MEDNHMMGISYTCKTESEYLTHIADVTHNIKIAIIALIFHYEKDILRIL